MGTILRRVSLGWVLFSYWGGAAGFNSEGASVRVGVAVSRHLLKSSFPRRRCHSEWLVLLDYSLLAHDVLCPLAIDVLNVLDFGSILPHLNTLVLSAIMLIILEICPFELIKQPISSI